MAKIGRAGLVEGPEEKAVAKAFNSDRLVIVPERLMPMLKAIAKRQETSVKVVVLQALCDYCGPVI
jgi:hypothetical protein